MAGEFSTNGAPYDSRKRTGKQSAAGQKAADQFFIMIGAAEQISKITLPAATGGK